MAKTIREAECRAMTGLSRTTRWSLERQGRFPKRFTLTGKTVGWLEDEVLRWLEGRVGRSVRPPERHARATADTPSSRVTARSDVRTEGNDDADAHDRS